MAELGAPMLALASATFSTAVNDAGRAAEQLQTVAERAARGEPTKQIETATLVPSADRGVGRRFAVDEHAFNPVRARVRAGTWFSFVNNGQVPHTIAALDGAWTAGTLKMAETGYVKIDKPATYRYACKEHPWAVGELTIE